MTESEWNGFIPEDIAELYEIHNYKNAAQILATAYPALFAEINEALRTFSLTTQDISTPGGNESLIPKKISALLRPLGWLETRVTADLVVKKHTKAEDQPRPVVTTDVKENYLDGHKIDYVKDCVAFDLEWNSKDQTFDRDLYAFRAFFECDVIGVGVLVTRSASMNSVFNSLGPEVRRKYGASTTWMGKLLYRLEAGRNGGCPVLVYGITPRLVTDWQGEVA